MPDTTFDPPSAFKDWFIRCFRTLIKFHFGSNLDAKLTVFKGSIKFVVVRVYGISFSKGFVGFMQLQLESSASKDT